MQKLIIDRKIWLRGEGASKSCLLRESDRKMCCLGIYLQKVCDFSDSDIMGVSEPIEIKTQEIWAVDQAHWMVDPNNPGRASSVCGDLMLANDTRELEEGEREKKIAELFSEVDVKVIFK